MAHKDIQLYDYQSKLLDDVESELAFGGGDYFVDSCVSSGKSFMISALAERLQGNIVILISISSLLEQIAEHLEIVGVPYSILKATHNNHYIPDCRIQLIMAQTLHSRLKDIDIKCDYLIQDEGHREAFSLRTTDILAKLKPSARLLFSGTPFDEKGFQFPNTQGTFKTVPMQDLIDQGRLCPVKYYVPKWAEQIDYERTKSSGNDYTNASLEEITNTQAHINKVIDSMNHLNAKNKKTLVFCSSIEQVELVTSMLKSDGYFVESYHSKTAKADQDAILSAFRNDTIYAGHKHERQSKTLFEDEHTHQRPIKCLVSINKLGIGFSVENVQLGVALRPTKIRALAEQIEGRVYRAHPSKQFAEFLDCSQLVRNFGFPEEHYEPPHRTNDRQADNLAIDKANDVFAMPKIDLILNDDNTPTLVNREIYNKALADAEYQEQLFYINKAAYYEQLKATVEDPDIAFAKRIATIINNTNDIYKLVEAGADFWTLYNGQPISKAGKVYKFNPDWLTEELREALAIYPHKYNGWLKAYRTRIKNLCKLSKNYNSIKFFATFLRENHEAEYELAKNQEPQTKIPMPINTLPDMDIDENDIPF